MLYIYANKIFQILWNVNIVTWDTMFAHIEVPYILKL